MNNLAIRLDKGLWKRVRQAIGNSIGFVQKKGFSGCITITVFGLITMQGTKRGSQRQRVKKAVSKALCAQRGVVRHIDMFWAVAGIEEVAGNAR